MDCFEVQGRGAPGLLLDCQADLLGGLNTRFIVPLLAERAARLNPLFEIDGQRLVMVTQFCAAIHARELGERVGSLADRQDEIIDALDMLISRF